GQARVLRHLERVVLQPFKFDADAEVVAVVSPLPARWSGMPGAIERRDELQQFAVAADHEMSGYLGTSDGFEVRMGVPVQPVGDEPFDLVTTVLAGRQADRVDDGQVDPGLGRARAEVWRGDAPGLRMPALCPIFLTGVAHCGSLR